MPDRDDSKLSLEDYGAVKFFAVISMLFICLLLCYLLFVVCYLFDECVRYTVRYLCLFFSNTDIRRTAKRLS